ncbi:hypothetical protein DJ021_16125 [Phenylobacterium hankyongense]|uniref:DUF3887 domain-containing protein n=1 Tax=Phenylobacterium hankyongense TaxID=1813876 RepID=A0A328B1D8_9CAUL|nr:hypothetical protein [Phenylobacterium hankyongense]RAK61220.1 hypothetical protein DJ021_16125 [Phenylobacterium hankyongense]
MRVGAKLAALGAVVLALVLTACSALRVDTAADQQARAVFAAVQRGDWRAVEPQLSPMVAHDPQLRSRLEQVRAFVPVDAPTAVKVINWQRSAGWTLAQGRAATTSITYLYAYPHRSLVVNIVFDRSRDAPTIAGIHVVPSDPKVLAANRFDAPGKSAAQYGFLMACALSPLLMLAAAVAAATTRQLPVRWLWAVLAFVGVGTLWMNWTTGVLNVVPLAVNLVGAGVTQSLPPLSPWIVRMTLPVGAVVVLARVWFARRRATAQERTFT